MKNTSRLREFVADVARLCEQRAPEAQTLQAAAGLMKTLVAHDDWLPAPFDQPHPVYYQQHLLYGDPLDRFSLVSFVWGPGQQTPIHDHTVWGVIGMLRGSEISQRYRLENERLVLAGEADRLLPGDVDCLSPQEGDVHRVSNAFADQVSISIHLYGGNIGRVHRSVFNPEDGARKGFVSGYSSAVTPNLWPA